MTAPEAPENVSRHYVRAEGRAYDEWQGADGALRGRLNRFKFARHVSPDDRLLDFGCSDGSLLAALRAASKVGVEPNPSSRARAAALGLEVYASLASVPDGQIDVAVSNHVLEHIPNPYGALVELHRVLRPGGRLVLCVPAEDWRTGRSWRGPDRNRHLYAWTPLTLGNLLMEAGFAVEGVTVLTHAWPPLYGRLFRRLPVALFHAVCRAWSVLRRRRQLIAVARR